MLAVCWLAAVLLAGCSQREAPEPVAATPAAAPEFVGGEVCAGCHETEARLWQGSHHDLAMQVADATTVLGDFDDARFESGATSARFFIRDDGFRVETDGPAGEPIELEVLWTFGVYPLQQYLVALDGGRVQALSVAWDARPAAEGGQRWMHLYPDEAIDNRDPLHWSGAYQRWNTMCADCHSTGLVKDYDTDTDSFATRFAGIDVGCEGCHGPGSLHAADPARPPPALAPVERSWIIAPGARIAARSPEAASAPEVEVCAQCHSRRAQFGDAYEPGGALLDAYRPALLEAGLYHADGQIEDEVYVYGSFLQSAMAAAGVACSDCHDPHTARLRADGNAVCAQCHSPAVFDQPAHHRHQSGTAAAECTACHMRAETYMVVDPRRDHSFRVPRPDLSAAIGAPNACSDCHRDESSAWAAERIAEWYPGGQWNGPHFGQALSAGRRWAADARRLLVALVEDEDEPAIARATALGLLAERFADADRELVERLLDREEPLLGLAAIDAAAGLAPEIRADLLQRFLTDERLAFRLAAGRALVPARAALSPRRQADLDAAVAEYLEAQRYMSDRPEGWLNRAVVAVEQGLYAEAEALYTEALARHPGFAPLYVNYADLERLRGRTAESEAVLRAGLAALPGDPAIGLALGFALVRSARPEEALALFEAAATASPEDPYYHYVLAIAVNDSGDAERAVALLRAAAERFPGHPDTLFALAAILRDQGELEAARDFARRLVSVRPGDAGAISLLSELGQRL